MARMPQGERPRAFIDTETTGLDPKVHEIIEIAYIVESPEGELLASFETKFKPQNLDVADPKALEINGYDHHPEEWESAPVLDRQHAEVMYDALKDCIMVGHNPGFDVAFLREGMKRAGMDVPWYFGKHIIDTVTLAYVQLVPCGLKYLSMDAIRRFLGWSSLRAHTAMKDVRDAQRLYHTLARATWFDRTWWKTRDWFRRLRSKKK